LRAAQVALIHDWLVAWRGGERVLQALATLFPGADIYTLVADHRQLPPVLQGRRIHTSWLQRLPVHRHFRWALPLFPWTIEQFRFHRYDLVISVSHTVARGVQTDGVPHLSYCLTPMRYTWVAPETYFGPHVEAWWSPQRALVQYLRRWELATLDRVHAFAAISRTVQTRIRQYYRRDSQVIYPPVDCALFERVPREPHDYYLVVSALVPYKQTALAIEAFNRLRRRLIIVGTGPEEPKLRRLAGPTVTFAGWQTPERLAQWYAGARALVYPQEEDFGLAAVEAQATGCPVIAFARGGATETVVNDLTGVFFDDPTADALVDAVERLGQLALDPVTARQQARQFDQQRFEAAFSAAASAMLGRGSA